MEVTNEPLVVDRRVRGDEAEYRFQLHRDLQKYFPDERVFDLLNQTFNELKDKDFKGLREDSCRFKLLEVSREIQCQNKYHQKYYKYHKLIPEKLNLEDFASASEERLDETYIEKSSFDIQLLEKAAERIDLSAQVIEQKGWTVEFTRRFLARTALLIFKSTVSTWPEKIPAAQVLYLLEQTDFAVRQILTNSEVVAREYVFNKVKYQYESDLLPDVKDQSKQTEEDKLRIAEAKKISKKDLAIRVLSSVRENSEYVRNLLTSRLLEQRYDTQSAFWEIHRGEFHQNPLETQMLSSGTQAEVSGYVEDKGGAQFYEENIG